MKPSEFKTQFDELISKADKILVCGHISHDLDAVGCAIGVKSYIRHKFPEKSVDIVFGDKRIDKFEFVPGYETINFFKDLEEVWDIYDTIVFVDGSEYMRFSKRLQPEDYKSKVTILIDHHEITDDKFNLELREPGRASAGQMVYQYLLSEFKQELDKKIIFALLVGIFWDSDTLKYVSTSDLDTFTIVKELLEIGNFSVADIQDHLGRMSKADFEVYRELVNNTRIVNTKHPIPITFSFLEADFLNKYRDEDTSLVKDNYRKTFLRNIDNSSWGFMVIPSLTIANKFIISFRSTAGAPNVEKLAKHLGGGGHPKSAGAIFISDEGVTAEQACLEILKKIDSIELDIIED